MIFTNYEKSIMVSTVRNISITMTGSSRKSCLLENKFRFRDSNEPKKNILQSTKVRLIGVLSFIKDKIPIFAQYSKD